MPRRTAPVSPFREQDASAESMDGSAGHRQEIARAREIRARGIVADLAPAQIAPAIQRECDTTWIRAYRLALGLSLTDVAAQIRAWYEAEGRTAPKFSETLLSAYESGQKRPGPEYLHYLCIVYRVEPEDIGFTDRCLCGRPHRGQPRMALPATASSLPGAVTGAGPADAPGGRAGPGLPEGISESAVPGQPASAGSSVAGQAAEEPGPAAQPGRSPEPAASPALAATARAAAPAHSVAVAQSTGSAQPVAVSGLPTPLLSPVSGAVVGHVSAEGGPWPSLLEGAFAVGVADADGSACEDDDDALRRAQLHLLADGASEVGEGFFGAADRIRRRMDDALASGTVSVTMLDQWEETRACYGRRYLAEPPLPLLCDVLLDFGDVRRMAQHRQPLEFSERLCRLAAQLAGLAGMVMIDVGQQRLARAFFRTARTAADETGDRHLRAWATVREAFVPLYYGDPGEAASLARAGSDLAGRKLSVSTSMAPVLEARSLARTADRADTGRRSAALRRASALLESARQAFDQLSPAQSNDGAYGYTERQLLFHEGDTLVRLGDHAGAEVAFREALRSYPREEILDRTLIGFGLAQCRLEAGQPEEALRLSRDTLLGLPPQNRSELCVRAAWSLGQRTADRHADLPAVREYREALLSA